MQAHDREPLSFPSWINHTEATERLATPSDLSEATITMRDGVRYHRADAAAPSTLSERVAEDTRRLREEDGWDRYHRGEGKPLGPALVSLAVICVWCLFIAALTWFGAAWAGHWLAGL